MDHFHRHARRLRHVDPGLGLGHVAIAQQVDVIHQHDGVLHDNARQNDAAKEDQSLNASRITEIRQILSVAKVVEDNGKKRSLKVSIGTTVELDDEVLAALRSR